jgi:hypothetical protein
VPAGISANETLAIGHRGLGAQTMSLCCVCVCVHRVSEHPIHITHLSDLYARSRIRIRHGSRKTDCENVIVHFAARAPRTYTWNRWNVVASFSECIKSNVHRRFYTKKCTLTSRENNHGVMKYCGNSFCLISYPKIVVNV